MDSVHDDRYFVFVRLDDAHNQRPDDSELPLAECESYEEARLVKSGSTRDCVIRFNGNVGGGD
jgi:hypothetical protein